MGKEKVQCHSLPVKYEKRCDETAWKIKNTFTHSLFIVERDVMRLPSKKDPVSLTSCWQSEEI
jgi:hypothetical protein